VNMGEDRSHQCNWGKGVNGEYAEKSFDHDEVLLMSGPNALEHTFHDTVEIEEHGHFLKFGRQHAATDAHPHSQRKKELVAYAGRWPGARTSRLSRLRGPAWRGTGASENLELEGEGRVRRGRFVGCGRLWG
jgi:hypothetical protein